MIHKKYLYAMQPKTCRYMSNLYFDSERYGFARTNVSRANS